MKRATLNHPKTIALAEAAGLTRRDTLGLLTLLWDFAGQYAPNGAVGRYTNAVIAGNCDWPPERADELVGHLVRTKWLDEVEDQSVRLLVHDWEDHCEGWVKKRVQREQTQFIRLSDHSVMPKRPDETSRRNGVPFRPPSPTPLTLPSQAKPSPAADENPKATKPRKPSPKAPPGFDEFWTSWPEHFRKKGRKQCLACWNANSLEEIADEILDSLKAHKNSQQWRRQNGQFIPGPLPWLNQQGWEASPNAGGGNEPANERRDCNGLTKAEHDQWLREQAEKTRRDMEADRIRREQIKRERDEAARK